VQAAWPPEAEAAVVAQHAEPRAAEARQDAAARPEEAAVVRAAGLPAEEAVAAQVASPQAVAGAVRAALPQARPAAGPSAAVSASRRDRALPWPVRQRSARFARARRSLQVASL